MKWKNGYGQNTSKSKRLKILPPVEDWDEQIGNILLGAVVIGISTLAIGLMAMLGPWLFIIIPVGFAAAWVGHFFFKNF